MHLEKDSGVLQQYNEATCFEWLETNGLGGYSSSTIIGCNERRYHGLLIAATIPPTERKLLLAKLEETIISERGRFELSTNNYGNTIHPQGYCLMKHFRKVLFPEFLYEVQGVILRKTVAMIHGEDTVVIIYDVLAADGAFTLELLPLLACRDHHHLQRSNEDVITEAVFQNDIYQASIYKGLPGIFIKCPQAAYHAAPNWYFNFHYRIEEERGSVETEDLFTQGNFSLSLKKGDSVGIIISTEDPGNRNAHDLFQQETARRRDLVARETGDAFIKHLVLAADQFIVQRGEGKTIIAGYHWFTDWGRDTMISLPGLCLATGRYDDARKILAAFAKAVSEGMLPNRFPDNNYAPEYNNVDGTLWFFIAVYRYLQASKDKRFVLDEILPVLAEIIAWYEKGTRFRIHEDKDGLIYAGEPGLQLTWMDAKAGDWVVTPRKGKAVEVNALWYNALKIYASLLQLSRKRKRANEITNKAVITQKNFVEVFWNENAGYLYDVVDGAHKDDCFRPNQLFAITLPFPLLFHKKAKMVLKKTTEKLYTPVGLRTLSPDDASYMKIYQGNQYHRDAAYHQGTVWSWLLGPYIDAIMKLQGVKAKAAARKVIEQFKFHLNEAGIGTVSEIFDAEPPHYPKGCIAQAWGVAEILRVMKQHDLCRLKRQPVKRASSNVKREA
jgi:predicted glycogen debranching enzyme